MSTGHVTPHTATLHTAPHTTTPHPPGHLTGATYTTNVKEPHGVDRKGESEYCPSQAKQPLAVQPRAVRQFVQGEISG